MFCVFPYSCISSVRFWSEFQLFRLRKAVNAFFRINSLAAAPGSEVDRWSITQAASFPGQYTIDETRFQTNIPIDGILLASSKFGQRRLVAKN